MPSSSLFPMENTMCTIVLVSSILISVVCCDDSKATISPIHSSIQGPGLSPDKIRLPCHYFFVNLRNHLNESLNDPTLSEFLELSIEGQLLLSDQNVGVKVETFYRGDGSFIARYKLYRTFKSLTITATVKLRNSNQKHHISGSPVIVDQSPVLSDNCACPRADFDQWLQDYGCLSDGVNYEQIDNDLQIFEDVQVSKSFEEAKKKFRPGSTSFCHYAVVNNVIHRQCFGQYVDFNIFVDALLLYLNKLVRIPDTEFLINLGDWPLIRKGRKGEELIPMISWCKTQDHADILWPTYELTQASLECMGRQVLDMLSVQGKSGSVPWNEKDDKAFFRGRDSRQERLDLVQMSKDRSDLFDVGITNYFFFREEEEKLGKADRVSFFDYFKYKYQLSLDGTVAAYRFPFLLAGNSVVLKQDSKYVEHFYSQISAGKHYVSFSSDLSNLTDQLDWIKENDDVAQAMISRAQKFSNENLLPQHVICYHAVFLNKWKAKLSRNDAVKVKPEMVVVNRESHYATLPNECPCPAEHQRDEL